MMTTAEPSAPLAPDEAVAAAANVMTVGGRGQPAPPMPPSTVSPPTEDVGPLYQFGPYEGRTWQVSASRLMSFFERFVVRGSATTPLPREEVAGAVQALMGVFESTVAPRWQQPHRAALEHIVPTVLEGAIVRREIDAKSQAETDVSMEPAGSVSSAPSAASTAADSGSNRSDMLEALIQTMQSHGWLSEERATAARNNPDRLEQTAQQGLIEAALASYQGQRPTPTPYTRAQERLDDIVSRAERVGGIDDLLARIDEMEAANRPVRPDHPMEPLDEEEVRQMERQLRPPTQLPMSPIDPGGLLPDVLDSALDDLDAAVSHDGTLPISQLEERSICTCGHLAYNECIECFTLTGCEACKVNAEIVRQAQQADRQEVRDLPGTATTDSTVDLTSDSPPKPPPTAKQQLPSASAFDDQWRVLLPLAGSFVAEGDALERGPGACIVAAPGAALPSLAAFGHSFSMGHRRSADEWRSGARQPPPPRQR